MYTTKVRFVLPSADSTTYQIPFHGTTSKRLTQHKTAVITIKNFKLIFTRVPLGALGMITAEPSLAIECLWFSILGSSGEAIFGDPKPITNHSDLNQWSECLKRDGGAGYVLSLCLVCLNRLSIIPQKLSQREKNASTVE